MDLPPELVYLIADSSDPVTQVAISFVSKAFVRYRRVDKKRFWKACNEYGYSGFPLWSKEYNPPIDLRVTDYPINSIADACNTIIFGPKATTNMVGAFVYGSGVEGCQTIKIQLNNFVYGDRLSLSDGSYLSLPFDCHALITAQIIGSDGSSAILHFVVRREKGKYEVVTETLCGGHPSAYTPLAIDLGVTIVLKNEGVRVNSNLEIVTVS